MIHGNILAAPPFPLFFWGLIVLGEVLSAWLEIIRGVRYRSTAEDRGDKSLSVASRRASGTWPESFAGRLPDVGNEAQRGGKTCARASQLVSGRAGI